LYDKRLVAIADKGLEGKIRMLGNKAKKIFKL